MIVLRRLAAFLFSAGAFAAPSLAAEPSALRGYNADIKESSISGISSGAFMAVQFATAWSSTIKGVGVVAGGPYWCAEGELIKLPYGLFSAVLLVPESWLAAQASTWRALHPCMKGPPPELSVLFQKADAKATSFEIDDPLQNISRQKIYLFHGYNDKVVAKSVTDAAADFYRHYLGDAARGNLYYQTALGAGHSLVVAGEPKASSLNACNANESPYIDECGYDQAGIILQHIYGALNPPNRGQLSGAIKPFDQSPYARPDVPGAQSLDTTGYVYVPKDCENGESCRIHIALHGCKQDAGDIQKRYVEGTGYNSWADTNHLIILYPQTVASPFSPLNPDACWDWWGYVNHTDQYITKSGKQIRTIKAMLDALTSGAKPATAATAAVPAAAPDALAVIDTSDTSADLVWAAVKGATAYKVSRAGVDGPFADVGFVTGPSFGDAGLTPKSTYRWRVSAMVDGVEGPASNAVSGVTRSTPAPCDNPGSCPIAR
ncbi:MAG: PHB depolymerase family esterase [Methylocystis sp.]